MTESATIVRAMKGHLEALERAIEELIEAVELIAEQGSFSGPGQSPRKVEDAAERARAALDAPPPDERGVRAVGIQELLDET